MKCAMKKRPNTIFGYKGKQVRDNIRTDGLVGHVRMLSGSPPGQGPAIISEGRFANCSMPEVVDARTQEAC